MENPKVNPLLPASISGLLLLMLLIGASPAAQDEGQEIVTGTLEELDLKNSKGQMRTDLGKPIFFEIVKPELLTNVRVGKRVTVQLDAEGRAEKIIEVPAPELPPS
jgi:hypothetical protein